MTQLHSPPLFRLRRVAGQLGIVFGSHSSLFVFVRVGKGGSTDVNVIFFPPDVVVTVSSRSGGTVEMVVDALPSLVVMMVVRNGSSSPPVVATFVVTFTVPRVDVVITVLPSASVVLNTETDGDVVAPPMLGTPDGAELKFADDVGDVPKVPVRVLERDRELAELGNDTIVNAARAYLFAAVCTGVGAAVSIG